MVGEGLDVLAEASAVVHDVQREAQPVSEPLDVLVEAGRLPMGVGEDGAGGDAVKRSLACHERHDGGLDAPAQAEDREGWFGPHQASASVWSSAGVVLAEDSPSVAVCLSLAVCSSSSVKRRRRRSWASGAGLQLIATTRNSPASLSGDFRLVWLLESFKLPLSSRLACARLGRCRRDTQRANADPATSVEAGRAERYPLEGTTRL